MGDDDREMVVAGSLIFLLFFTIFSKQLDIPISSRRLTDGGRRRKISLVGVLMLLYSTATAVCYMLGSSLPLWAISVTETKDINTHIYIGLWGHVKWVDGVVEAEEKWRESEVCAESTRRGSILSLGMACEKMNGKLAYHRCIAQDMLCGLFVQLTMVMQMLATTTSVIVVLCVLFALSANPFDMKVAKVSVLLSFVSALWGFATLLLWMKLFSSIRKAFDTPDCSFMGNCYKTGLSFDLCICGSILSTLIAVATQLKMDKAQQEEEEEVAVGRRQRALQTLIETHFGVSLNGNGSDTEEREGGENEGGPQHAELEEGERTEQASDNRANNVSPTVRPLSSAAIAPSEYYERKEGNNADDREKSRQALGLPVSPRFSRHHKEVSIPIPSSALNDSSDEEESHQLSARAQTGKGTLFSSSLSPSAAPHVRQRAEKEKDSLHRDEDVIIRGDHDTERGRAGGNKSRDVAEVVSPRSREVVRRHLRSHDSEEDTVEAEQSILSPSARSVL